MSGFGAILGSGGASYGFKVYSASSVGGLPSGSAGDIGVITTTAVNKTFIGNETISAPSSGDISIETTEKNNACPVDIIKGGNITVYPYRCSQYESSVWVVKEFYIWSSGAWVSPYAYLYHSGQEYPAYTGGWKPRGWPSVSGSNGGATVSLTRYANYMSLLGTGSNFSSFVAEVITNIDLTSISTIAATIYNYTINSNNPGNTVLLVAVSRSATYWMTSAAASTIYLDTTGIDQTKAINVSALSGTYDVLIGVHNSTAAGCQVLIKDVYVAA